MGDEQLSDATELLDLPDLVLLQILQYLDHDTLRHVIANVNKFLRSLSYTPSLWDSAVLSYNGCDNWEAEVPEQFIHNILATPYLQELRLATTVEDEGGPVWCAVLDSPCRIQQLQLEESHYSAEAYLLLQRHPELRELTLQDMAYDDEVTAMLARQVGVLASSLHSLDLSQSHLLSLDQAGGLLAGAGDSPDQPESCCVPARDAAYVPAGGEPSLPPGPGLTRLTYEPSASMRHSVQLSDHQQTASANLAALIRAHRHSLRAVFVNDPATAVLEALAECSHLEELRVTSDSQGVLSRRLLPALAARPLTPLRSLCLRLAASSETLSALMEAVSALRGLQSLELRGDPHGQCPGFHLLRPLLEAGLRELRVSDLTPVGRVALDELRLLAPSASSLRLLHITDCSCSSPGDYSGCRDRVIPQLMSALPNLDVQTDSSGPMDNRYDVGFLPIYTCSCARRPPGRQRSQRQ